jgi:hypothetical protein
MILVSDFFFQLLLGVHRRLLWQAVHTENGVGMTG